jgi:hypothetical protein
MHQSWKEISVRLNQEVYPSHELFEALLDDSDEIAEKSHWWSFLAEEFSGVSVNDLIKGSKIVSETVDQNDKEIGYCRLLHIESPLTPNAIGPQARRDPLLRGVPPMIITTDWLFRWLYTIVPSPELTGKMLATLRREIREGKIRVPDRLFKRAAFIDSVKNGTPGRLAADWIEADAALLRGNPQMREGL